MALNYKLVIRKVSDLKGGPKTERMFANPSYGGYAELPDLCKMISERSALSSADVKGVLDSLNYVLDQQLRAGMIVRMGELGNFRLSFSSKGIDPQTGKFNPISDIVRSRIIFTPGKALRDTKLKVDFIQSKDVVNANPAPTAPEVPGGEGNGGGHQEI